MQYPLLLKSSGFGLSTTRWQRCLQDQSPLKTPYMVTGASLMVPAFVPYALCFIHTCMLGEEIAKNFKEQRKNSTSKGTRM